MNTFMNAPLWSLVAFAGCGLGAGLLLRLWLASRRFHRRNVHGVEVFSNHLEMVGARLTESAVSIVSTLLILIGLAGGIALAGRYLLGML